MNSVNNKIKRRLRNRKKLKSVNINKYRISVSKSLNNLSAQIIDDAQNKTLVSVSSTEKDIKSKKIKKMEWNFNMPENRKIESDIKEKLVAINRITKVVKGGRRFGFAALVVVGNQKGSVGIGQGKSKQVPDAIKKATEVAKRNLIKIPLKDGRTLHHDVKGKNGSGKVFLRSAPAGTGIIAGGPIRSVCEVLGIQDVVAKSLGSANPHNVLKACVNGLRSQNSPKILSAIRGKKISDIVIKRDAE